MILYKPVFNCCQEFISCYCTENCGQGNLCKLQVPVIWTFIMSHSWSQWNWLPGRLIISSSSTSKLNLLQKIHPVLPIGWLKKREPKLWSSESKWTNKSNLNEASDQFSWKTQVLFINSENKLNFCDPYYRNTSHSLKVLHLIVWEAIPLHLKGSY